MYLLYIYYWVIGLSIVTHWQKPGGCCCFFFLNFKVKKKEKKKGSYLLNFGSRKKTLLFGFFWQVFAGLLKLHFWVLMLLYFSKQALKHLLEPILL